jgi:hypothetical protein
MKISINNEIVDATAEQEAEFLARQKEWVDDTANRKLKQIKEIRLQKLIETDYLANSDVTMPDNVKTWRQTLRDLPANHTDEAAYDALLARDSDGNLTNSVWSKP